MCRECERLEAERQRYGQALNRAISAMNAAAGNSDNAEEYMKLRATAQEARIDLTLAEAQLCRHQRMHGPISGGRSRPTGRDQTGPS
jgi:hypothetical protein